MRNFKCLVTNTQSNAFLEVHKNNRQKFFDKYKSVLSEEQVDKLEDVARHLTSCDIDRKSLCSLS
jgi:hypothetical protein